MQQLPDGIRAVPPPAWPEGQCQVCREVDDTPDNQILQCDACRACVHMECCGVSTPPDGRLWLCDVCALGQPLIPSAAACCAASACSSAWPGWCVPSHDRSQPTRS